MSPLTLEKIKKANGRVRIVENNSEYCIQILDKNVWTTIFKSNDKTICESAIQKANSKLILG